MGSCPWRETAIGPKTSVQILLGDEYPARAQEDGKTQKDGDAVDLRALRIGFKAEPGPAVAQLDFLVLLFFRAGESEVVHLRPMPQIRVSCPLTCSACIRLRSRPPQRQGNTTRPIEGQEGHAFSFRICRAASRISRQMPKLFRLARISPLSQSRSRCRNPSQRDLKFGGARNRRKLTTPSPGAGTARPIRVKGRLVA